MSPAAPSPQLSLPSGTPRQQPDYLRRPPSGSHLDEENVIEEAISALFYRPLELGLQGALPVLARFTRLQAQSPGHQHTDGREGLPHVGLGQFHGDNPAVQKQKAPELQKRPPVAHACQDRRARDSRRLVLTAKERRVRSPGGGGGGPGTGQRHRSLPRTSGDGHGKGLKKPTYLCLAAWPRKASSVSKWLFPEPRMPTYARMCGCPKAS